MCKVSWLAVLLSLSSFVTICMRIIFMSWHENQMLMTNHWLTEGGVGLRKVYTSFYFFSNMFKHYLFCEGMFLSTWHQPFPLSLSCRHVMFLTRWDAINYIVPLGDFFFLSSSSWAWQSHKVLSDCDHSGEEDKGERTRSHTQDRKQLRKTRKHTTQNGALTLYCTSHV